MSTVQLSTPPAYHFNENDFFSTQAVYLFNNAIYKFMSDGVGSHASGGGTEQIFIQKSTDQGVTWTDVTPGSPQKFEGPRGQVFVRSGNRVYCSFVTNRNNPSPWKWFIFDFPTEAWVTDSSTVNQGNYANVDTEIGWGTAVRTNGDIIVAWGGSSITLDTTVAVYTPGSDTWANLGQVSGLANAEICGGVVDSSGRAHFLAVAWSGATFGQGTATVVHFVVFANNIISGVDTIYTFVNIPNSFFPWIQVSVPVSYFDPAATHMLAFTVGTCDTNENITGVILFTAPQANVPFWTQTVVPTGENFSQVTIDTSEVAAMSVLTLLPVVFSNQTQLHIFWTSNGFFFSDLGHNWPNFMRHLSYTNGVFSAVTTEYHEVSERLMGAVYPIIVSQSGSSATIGGHTATIDDSLFFSLETKYQALALWWMSYTASAPAALALSCNNPPQGAVGASYSSALLATGGTPPYTFAVIAGGLPPGLSLGASTGVISGIPTTAGTYAFTAQVTDNAGATAAAACSITIIGSMFPKADGGGGGWECRVAQCIPAPQSCPQWGPVSLAKQNGQYVGIYRDSLGQVRQFAIDPHIDAINQLAAGVMRIERGQIDPRTNNPGRLIEGPRQIGEFRGAAVFATLDDGVQALKDAIANALTRMRREIY